MISPLCYSPSLLPPPSSPFLRRPVPLGEYAKKGGGPGSDKLPEAKKAAAPKAADREEEEEEEEGGGGGGEWLWPAMSEDAAEVHVSSAAHTRAVQTGPQGHALCPTPPHPRFLRPLATAFAMLPPLVRIPSPPLLFVSGAPRASGGTARSSSRPPVCECG